MNFKYKSNIIYLQYIIYSCELVYVYILYVCIHGSFMYFKELIFKLEGFKPFGWYLTLVQFACYSVIGVVELQFRGEKERRYVKMTNKYIC